MLCVFVGYPISNTCVGCGSRVEKSVWQSLRLILEQDHSLVNTVLSSFTTKTNATTWMWTWRDSGWAWNSFKCGVSDLVLWPDDRTLRRIPSWGSHWLTLTCFVLIPSLNQIRKEELSTCGAQQEKSCCMLNICLVFAYFNLFGVDLKRFQKLLAAAVYWVCQWGLDVVFN